MGYILDDIMEFLLILLSVDMSCLAIDEKCFNI